jgi:hypothetical protein
MCVGPDENGGTGYKSKTKYDYAWTSGVATFWVKDWGRRGYVWRSVCQ